MKSIIVSIDDKKICINHDFDLKGTIEIKQDDKTLCMIGGETVMFCIEEYLSLDRIRALMFGNTKKEDL
jgi:hypothetical protein